MTADGVDGRSPEIMAYTTFYLASVPRLSAFLMLKGTSPADAADCVQETLIEALPPVWATLEKPYPWCRTVAYRKSCDLATRRREVPVTDVELVHSALIAPGTDLEHLECKHELLSWLARLDGPRQRDVLAWTYDGATPADIAVSLNMKPATVRSTLRDARAAMRRLRANGGAPS